MGALGWVGAACPRCAPRSRPGSPRGCVSRLDVHLGGGTGPCTTSPEGASLGAAACPLGPPCGPIRKLTSLA